MNKGLISVIIPMYNVEKYLRKCVESIENQTYNYIETILIDDGSNDKTLDIANKLKEQYANIKVISKKNGGQASARNIGLQVAMGEYISFIDSDDFIDNEMFSTMLTIAEKYNLDIIECCYQDVFCNTEKKGNVYYLNAEKDRVYSGVEFYNLKPSLSPCDKLYRKSFLDSFSFKCTEGHYAEDAYDTTNAIINAKRISHINKVFYYYRRDNMNSTRNNQNIERRVKLGQDKLFIANKLDELRVKNSLNGYISTIIVRNTVGTILCPIFIKNKEYRMTMLKSFKKSNGIKLIRDNVSIPTVIELIGVGFRKLLTKGD